VNDVDLSVTMPDGEQIWGNFKTVKDDTNTVEHVTLDPKDYPQFFAAGGDLTITVTGANIVLGPQAYAIVVDGPFTDGTVNAGVCVCVYVGVYVCV